MPVVIEGGNPVSRVNVNKKGRFEVAAFSEEAIQDAADLGNVYTWVSTYAATAGQQVISIKNTSSSLHLHLTRIWAGSTIDTLWSLFKVTSGTAAGTDLVERNLNLAFADNAPSISFGNASVTGSLAGNNLALWYTLADTSPLFLDFGGGLRLDENQEIALTADATGVVAVTILGFFS